MYSGSSFWVLCIAYIRIFELILPFLVTSFVKIASNLQAIAMLQNLDFARKKEIIRSFREGIYEAFDYECAYCGDRAESLDHAKPKAKGGETIASNLLPSCLPCNQNKGSQELFDWYRQRNSWTAEREQAIANWLFD